MTLADNPASHPNASYDKLELLHVKVWESHQGYITEWSVTENLKCPAVIFSGYNESNVNEITIKSESKVNDVKSSNVIYECIIPEKKRELIQKRAATMIIM